MTSLAPPGAAGRQEDYSQRTTVTNGHERDDMVAAAGRARKKEDAVKGAEQTIAGTGWLPTCLRTLPQTVAQQEVEPTEENAQDA